eukprot:1146978-Pelagomonas_calceolata.AAC.7
MGPDMGPMPIGPGMPISMGPIGPISMGLEPIKDPIINGSSPAGQQQHADTRMQISTEQR